MAPSVRVKRRHAYASIHDEDRYASEWLLDDPELARLALSEGASAPSPSAASEPMPLPRESVPSSSPRDTSRLAPGYVPPRGDTNRVNRHVRTRSISYRSFIADSDSDSGSDIDSEDEDRIMEDDEYNHDDDVVDHLDVIGPRLASLPP
jgi:hypothetical protein